MTYRNANYAAFYVDTPFSQSNLGANEQEDFRYYNMLRMWKGQDSSFAFNDAHGKTYAVRDDSSWETLKARIRTRLANSKNIVLFLSCITKNSRALREEMEYGIETKGLPVIVVYPDYSEKADIIVCDTKKIRKQIKDLWDNLPSFRNNMDNIPSIHVPMRKALIKRALEDPEFMIQTAGSARPHFYPC